MSALIDSNADYEAITWFKVDWDTFKGDLIVADLNIPRRSTLVTFKDGKEVARVIAQTTVTAIEPILKAAL